MRILNLYLWSFLALLLVSSCDEKIIEEENHISPNYKADSVSVFKKVANLKSSNISSTTTDDLFVNRDFYAGETNLYIINNVKDNWSIEVFDRSSLEHKSSLKTWTEGTKTKKFRNYILHVSENKGRLYVTNRSQVQIFDSNNFEFIARAGTGGWWTDESITLSGGFVALSFKDKLFVRDRYNLVVFNESDLIKDKPQKEIKVVTRTKKGALGDMIGYSQASMYINKGLIYLTDPRKKRISIFDPETIIASEEIPILREINLRKEPLSITFYQNNIYILCKGGQVLIYDVDSSEQVNQMSGIDKYLFKPSINRFGISAYGDKQFQIFINDIENKEIVVGLIENVKIKRYE